MKKWYQWWSFLVTVFLWFVGPIILVILAAIVPFAAAPAIYSVMLVSGIGTAVWFVCENEEGRKCRAARIQTASQG